MLTRWLLIALLISVCALLFVAGAVVRHVRRQRRGQSDESAGRGPEISDLAESEPFQREEPGEKR